MPLDQTVEYEEDFSHNMMIHREFISKKYKNQMSFALAPLAPSDMELGKAKETLASNMNRERKAVVVGSAGSEGDRVQMNIDVDDDTREVRSARYLFSDARMKYCDRFQQFFTGAVLEALKHRGSPYKTT
ncbi:hypothetical protein AGDE_16962 [Angomonas deanei]|uniref:Uncharacterized protein n=1 Tax=Angomonas deanei TaxID=59799 RepID=A0A7G2CL89_9TRYP|nr:hypothetical protein AGDE_16962 [Angomonas deanei]CAD2220185.1 hypothetical protein, conserved [Angomonas deanei]|eukprot:EPY15806.1 hypothetical protein AGDE_16962 [Angomonas deanei]